MVTTAVLIVKEGSSNLPIRKYAATPAIATRAQRNRTTARRFRLARATLMTVHRLS